MPDRALLADHVEVVAARAPHLEQRDAARLAGASAALHERIGAPAWESVTAIHDRALSGAHAALGRERYAGHFAEGRRQSAEDAVARLPSETVEALASTAP